MAYRIIGNPVVSPILLDITNGGANISCKHETRLTFYPDVSEQVKNLGFTIDHKGSMPARKLSPGTLTYRKRGIGTTLQVLMPRLRGLLPS